MMMHNDSDAALDCRSVNSSDEDVGVVSRFEFKLLLHIKQQWPSNNNK